MKLACGFEILLQTGRRNLKRAGGAAAAAASAGASGVAAGEAAPSLPTGYAAALERCGYYSQCGDGGGGDGGGGGGGGGSQGRQAADRFAATVLSRLEEDEEVLLEDGCRFGGGAYDDEMGGSGGEGGGAAPKSKASASLAHSRSVRSASLMDAVLMRQEQQQPDTGAETGAEAEAGATPVGQRAAEEAERARRGRMAALGVGEMLGAVRETKTGLLLPSFCLPSLLCVCLEPALANCWLKKETFNHAVVFCRGQQQKKRRKRRRTTIAGSL
jgi:hypothetical protein